MKFAQYGTTVVVVHAIAHAMHGLAHVRIPVPLSALQGLFIVTVIFLIPIVAAALLWTKFYRIGSWLLLSSMAGAIFFGIYNHFIVISPDHVSHRKFLSQPVPQALLDEALALAQHAPSNSNIQPWRVVFAEGVQRDCLKEALLNQAKQQPNVSQLPQNFQHYRQELGVQVYGAMGIARDDKVNRQLAVLRNYEFFGAPIVGIVCMHQDLGFADALSVAMYLQTLVLCLTARGIGTCVEVSLAAYPEIIRSELNIPPELLIICGLAVGYSDPDFPANHLHVSRDAVEKNVSFLD